MLDLHVFISIYFGSSNSDWDETWEETFLRLKKTWEDHGLSCDLLTNILRMANGNRSFHIKLGMNIVWGTILILFHKSHEACRIQHSFVSYVALESLFFILFDIFKTLN